MSRKLITLETLERFKENLDAQGNFRQLDLTNTEERATTYQEVIDALGAGSFLVIMKYGYLDGANTYFESEKTLFIKISPAYYQGEIISYSFSGFDLGFVAYETYNKYCELSVIDDTVFLSGLSKQFDKCFHTTYTINTIPESAFKDYALQSVQGDWEWVEISKKLFNCETTIYDGNGIVTSLSVSSSDFEKIKKLDEYELKLKNTYDIEHILHCYKAQSFLQKDVGPSLQTEYNYHWFAYEIKSSIPQVILYDIYYEKGDTNLSITALELSAFSPAQQVR